MSDKNEVCECRHRRIEHDSFSRKFCLKRCDCMEFRGTGHVQKPFREISREVDSDEDGSPGGTDANQSVV